MNKQIKLVLSIIITLIIVGGASFYLSRGGASVEEESDYFTFKVMNEDLSQFKIDQFTEKFENAKAAVELNPDDFNFWVVLGSAKKQVGDYKGAEEIWIHAGEIRPLNSTSFNNLADLYTNFTKEYDKAESAHFITVQNSAGEPQNPGFYRNFYSFYLYNLENLDKAEVILLEAIAVNPNSAELYALLGYFYRDQRDDTTKAIEYFEKNLELNPDNTQVKKDLDKLR